MTPHEQTIARTGGTAVPVEGISVLLRRASGVLGSHVVAAALGIASLPVLARALGPAEYGRLSLFLTLLGVVTYQDFLRPLLVRALASGSVDDTGVRALSGLVAWSLAAIAAVAGALAFTPLVAICFAVAVLAHGLASVDYARLALAGRVAGAAFVRNIAWGSAAVASALAASTLPEGSNPAWFAAPFCLANVSILAIYRARVGGSPTSAWRAGTLRLARAAWSEHRRAILGLVGFGLANALVVSADRLIAEHYLEAEAFGLYAGCADLASKLAIVGSAVGTVLYPSFARHSDGSQTESRRFVSIASRVLLAWAAALGVLVLASSRLVPFVLGEDYAGAAWICTALFAASFVHMLGFLVTPWQRARGDFLTQTRAYAVAGVAMLCVGWALVPVLGIAGAVACACTARLAEIQLCWREARALGRRVLTPLHVGSLGTLALGLAALAWWRASGAA